MMLLIILSLAIPGSCMNYSHYLARNISLTLCDAAYMSNPSDSLRSKLSASDVQGFYAELDGGSCSGLIVTLPKRNIVALAFRAELYEPFYFDNWNKFYFPMITGHYVGGGLAALVALDIVKEEIVNKDDVILITLAQIMAGDKDFVEAYEKQVVKSYRVITKGDLIPHVPGKKHGYEYNGKEINFEFVLSASELA
ncbi:triacylglycerol lipase [Ancylostoma ceylanicum]|uniref:Triacylglycerol lipase n=1 Tax=Ancylostoma ceylanicum TaxID=53326 RepID=A0A0D6M4M4_9BILA|nr:triacylglycerol lipase [Ancylostoma ceylanicum]